MKASIFRKIFQSGLLRMSSVCLPLVFLTVGLSAQGIEMSVDGIRPDPDDADAASYFRQTDANDKVCALIKVKPSNPMSAMLVLNTGGGMAPVEPPKGQTNKRDDGDWWFWLSPLTKNIFFTAEGYQATTPLGVSLQPGMVYRLNLTVGAALHYVQTADLTEEAMKLHISPLQCVVSYGTDTRYSLGRQDVTNGYFEVFLTYGIYNFKVESEYYETYTGTYRLEKDAPEQQITLKPAFGYLRITSEPPGADVYLDGSSRSAGKTPLTTPMLMRGRHSVRIWKEDYYGNDIACEVVPDGSVQDVPPVRLKPQFGMVTCLCEDPQAELTVTDAAGNKMGEGKSGLKVRLASKRDYKLTASRPSHYSQSTLISGQSLEGKEIDARVAAPVPRYGTFQLVSDPPRASVFIDDRYVGTTGLIERLLIGEHRVSLRLDGYEEDSFPIYIDENNKTKIERRLTELPKRVQVRVSSATSALLYLDGVYIGCGSCDATLDIGRTYELMAKRPDCHSGQVSIKATAGMTAIHVPYPVPIAGTLNVDIKGADGAVQLHLSGTGWSEESHTVYSRYSASLKPGKYSVWATAPEYRDTPVKSFSIRDARTTSVSLQMRKIPRFSMSEWGFASHFIDFTGAYNIRNQDILAGLRYSWCEKHMGLYLSARYGIKSHGFSAMAGPVFRLTTDEKAVDYQLYFGGGYLTGEWGGEAGMRFGWRSDGRRLSRWDFTIGLAMARNAIVPELGLGLFFPIAPVYGLVRLGQEKIYASDYGKHFLDTVVGYNFVTSDVPVGFHYAFCPHHLGFYLSSMIGVLRLGVSANVGLVFRLTDGWGSFDYQLYGGMGYDYGHFGGDGGMRFSWKSGTWSKLHFMLGFQGSKGGLVPVFGLSADLFLLIGTAGLSALYW